VGGGPTAHARAIRKHPAANSEPIAQARATRKHRAADGQPASQADTTRRHPAASSEPTAHARSTRRHPAACGGPAAHATRRHPAADGEPARANHRRPQTLRGQQQTCRPGPSHPWYPGGEPGVRDSAAPRRDAADARQVGTFTAPARPRRTVRRRLSPCAVSTATPAQAKGWARPTWPEPEAGSEPGRGAGAGAGAGAGHRLSVRLATITTYAGTRAPECVGGSLTSAKIRTSKYVRRWFADISRSSAPKTNSPPAPG
jgi:hypothetical protein